MSIPAGDGVALLFTAILMMALSWLFTIGRVAVRRWKKALGADDWLMCIGLIIYTVTCSLCIGCCYYGAGQLSSELSTSDIMQGTKLFFIAEFFYASSTVPIKCSICATLLRIADPRRRFVWTLWAIIGLTIVASVIFIVAIANICHPITTLWGETTNGTCHTELNSDVSFLFSAVAITTDLTLAIFPAVLLWNVQLKQRIKLSVAFILGLAAFASCATIIRLRYLTLYNNQAEFMFSTGKIGMWSIIEEGIGIIAGSMPALRPILNLPFFKGSSAGTSEHSAMGGAFRRASSQELVGGHPPTVKMDTLSSTTGDGVDSDRQQRGSADADGDSQKHILKETRVTVTNEHCSVATGEDWGRSRVNGWKHERL